MKFGITTFLALGGLLVGTIANPLPGQLVRRTTNIEEIFAQVESHTSAALAICAEANIDIHADLDVRAAVAAKLKADLQAAAALLAEAAADIKASAEAEIVAANGGCDASCVEGVVVEHSTTFCESIEVVVETLGEDCVKEYVKPCMESFGTFTTCLDGVFVGIGASVGAVVKGVLGASLSLSLGLDLGLILGLGGIIGIGR